jgi:hypothetical protein
VLADANKLMKFIDEAFNMAITEPRLVDTTKVTADITELKEPMKEISEVCKIYPWYCFESLSAKGYENVASIVHNIEPQLLSNL